jgi:hypothetical protein
MTYYSRYVIGRKRVVYGVSLLQLVLTWPSWAYHVVKPYCTQSLPCSSLVRLLLLKTASVSLTLPKCTPWILVIIDHCPCGFTRAFERLSFIYFAESWMSKLTPHRSLFLPANLTQFGWSLTDLPNLLTSYPSTSSTELRSLSLAFGSNCMRPLRLTWFIVQPITRRRTTKLRELTKL